ncbi:hypothetical protein [Halococcus agarilyticus]|uniref:hypothetical protein n=1 Tax=Halococcus agarilyticus TaxID=1232219 RepID=UPI001E33B0E8|nr:hypothetical protein [Halococcus agarilyticus]
MSLVVGVLVGGLAIYFGVPLGSGRATPTVEESFATAAVGTVLSVVVTLLFGWIPLVGAILPAAAWVGVISHRTDARPPTAVGVGVAAWAVALVATTGVSVLLLGGFQ